VDETDEIYTIGIDGKGLQRVTSSPLQEALASWSPDGNALAFMEFTTTGAIWIARRTKGGWGAPVRRLDHGFWPNWSPDGRELSFSDRIEGGALGVVPDVPELVEPVELMAEAAVALCSGDPASLTGRVVYTRPFLEEIGRPARALDGTPMAAR
jgi:hypothetical protein